MKVEILSFIFIIRNYNCKNILKYLNYLNKNDTEALKLYDSETFRYMLDRFIKKNTYQEKVVEKV